MLQPYYHRILLMAFANVLTKQSPSPTANVRSFYALLLRAALEALGPSSRHRGQPLATEYCNVSARCVRARAVKP